MEPICLQGRTLSGDDLTELRALIAQHPDWHRTALSRHLCELWNWRSGKHVPQTQGHRDPLGPPFQTNLRWGHRFLQASLVLPLYRQDGQSSSRSIPVRFEVAKPRGRLAVGLTITPGGGLDYARRAAGEEALRRVSIRAVNACDQPAAAFAHSVCWTRRPGRCANSRRERGARGRHLHQEGSSCRHTAMVMMEIRSLASFDCMHD